MEAAKDRLIVRDGRCACGAVHTKQIHHRDFPEIWVEGGDVREGAHYLKHQLHRAREHALIGWRRTAVNRALADLDEFIEAIAVAELERPQHAGCTCSQSHEVRPAFLAVR